MASTFDTNFKQLEKRLRDFPLLRDLNHFVVQERWLESYDTYARLALDTAHSVHTSAYLVDESTIDDLENLKRYDRVWATIPATWEEFRSVGFDYPGFDGTYGNPGSVISAGVSAALDGNDKLVVTKTSHGLTTSDYVILTFSAAYNSGLPIQHRSVYKIAAATTDTFTVGHIFLGSGTWSFSSVTYQTIDGVPSRALRTETPTARILHEYALPGVTTGVSTATDFQAHPRLLFLSAAGEPVTHLTASTSPTNSAWIASAQGAEWFVHDSEVRPYLGNILERVTTLVAYRI